MLKLLLLAGASLAPAFSFSNEERAGHEADVFFVSSVEDTKATLEQLIDQESEPSSSANSALRHSQGGKIAVTILQYGSDEATIAYVYHEVSGAEGDDYLCRIRIDPKSEVGFFRTMKWCLSFIDPAYRSTVIVPPMKPR